MTTKAYAALLRGINVSGHKEALARPAPAGGVVATTRNWNTVTKLAELTRAHPA